MWLHLHFFFKFKTVTLKAIVDFVKIIINPLQSLTTPFKLLFLDYVKKPNKPAEELIIM